MIKNHKKLKLLLVPAVLFWGFFGYMYVMDFYYVNKFVWEKSNEIASMQNIDKSLIKSSHSWQQLYPNKERKWLYYFEYAGTEKQKPGDETFVQVEKHKVEFFGNFYIDPYVYLYKRK